MGQGIIFISATALLEVLADAIDLDTVKARFLLPERYRVEKLDVKRDHSGLVEIGVSAPDIPDGLAVTPIYERAGRSEPGGRFAPEKYVLRSIRIESGKPLVTTTTIVWLRNIRLEDDRYIGREMIDGHLDGHRYYLKPGVFERRRQNGDITKQYEGEYKGETIMMYEGSVNRGELEGYE